MGRQTDVERAFNSYFGTLGYTYVSYPGGPKVTPPASGLNYQIDVQYKEAVAATASLDASTRCSGDYVITIRTPEAGEGTGALLTAAETLAGYFKRGSIFRYPSTLSVISAGLAPSGTLAPSSILAPSSYVTGYAHAGLASSQTLAPSSFLVPSSTILQRTNVFCRSPTIRHLGNVTPEWYAVEVRVPWYADV